MKLGIERIINERNALDSIPRLELETLRRIVDDHNRAEITAEEAQVLHEYAFGHDAMVAEETGGYDMIRIHLV